MAIAIPWYWLAVLRNPGFLWDSVVNQQLLRFFNEELPRDFVPDSLGFFWAMLLVRTLPWSALLPAALLHGWRDVNRRATLRLPVAWMAVVLAVFSLSPLGWSTIRCPRSLRWHWSSACFSPTEPPGGRASDGRGP